MATVGIAAPSRIGQIEGAGTATELFLKVFSGEVLTTFQDRSVMLDKHMMRTITSGKSAQFPVVGRADSVYHTVGENIIQNTGADQYLQNILHNERVITIDDKLIAPTMLSDVDEAMNHYDVRSPYATELGGAIARTLDKQVLQLGLLGAADSTGNLSGETYPGTGTVGNYANSSSAATDANFILDSGMVGGIRTAAQTFDELNIPKEDRYVFVQPAEYYKLLGAAKDFVNRDYAGQGSLATGDFPRIFGFQVVETIHLPNTNISTGPTKYQIDARNTTALCLHKSALGTVKLRDLATEMDWKSEYQAWLMLAKVLCGSDYLRPEACYHIRTATPV